MLKCFNYFLNLEMNCKIRYKLNKIFSKVFIGLIEMEILNYWSKTLKLLIR